MTRIENNEELYTVIPGDKICYNCSPYTHHTSCNHFSFQEHFQSDLHENLDNSSQGIGYREPWYYNNFVSIYKIIKYLF